MKKNYTEEIVELKLSMERIFEKLASIEKYFQQSLEHQAKTNSVCFSNTEERIKKIEKSIEDHGKRIGKLEQSIAKFIGAATIAGALTGVITSIISKLILK